MNWDLIWLNAPMFLHGLLLTLWLVCASVLISFVIAVPLAIARVSRNRWVAWPVAGYTLVMRGTPLLVQLFIVYYGLAQFAWMRDSWVWPWFSNATFCAIFAFVLNTTAYSTEIFAGAIRTVHHGEVEAAQSFGMSRVLVYRRIVLPSMLRAALSQYSNEVIMMLQATSIASTVTLLDITGVARYVSMNYYISFEPYVTAGALYLVLTLALTRLFRLAESRWLRHLAPRAH
ncbi:ABC transporter permease [Paraburkholderia sp. Ac-20347]|jgi:arginine/ornithine transport system permease protein|uniref:ABC transporter permease n=1 Tax=Paraburkholderia sp. Ac-20347 TaxID=2703892 RepID=UPI00197F0462|nr:ABC transporter permease [Paraburkholderia sp. Ac-20347]MBN3811486.1 ABC transporter permease [Paraburkholderia sp. Ac-20347]